jgi:hypothetical protein
VALLQRPEVRNHDPEVRAQAARTISLIARRWKNG